MNAGSNAGMFKDEILDSVARTANVAQFVSFDPERQQRFAWINGHAPNASFASMESAVSSLLARSPEHSVNVRSFHPASAKSREFVYGLKTDADAASVVRRLGDQGLFTIVNETVDVNDGGVSGVAFADLVEFAPGDSPRCVEKPGTAAFPRQTARRLFATVYGFEPVLPADESLRVEFSLHPIRRGYLGDHTIIWEIEAQDSRPESVQPVWPNHFSRAIGDKAFGLLVAWLNGADVPRTLVVSRRIAPFQFGSSTGSNEPWIRTCPVEQVPGKFTTARGWLDPFRLVQAEDPDGVALASILCQEGVTAQSAGAAMAQAGGGLLVEGVRGGGDAFMIGARGPERLPPEATARVEDSYRRLSSMLGPVRFEWVDDGQTLWIVQLHRGASISVGRTIYPGTAKTFVRFPVTQGLERLRLLITRAQQESFGIILVGQVGVTSHFGDVLRKAQIPSRIEPSEL